MNTLSLYCGLVDASDENLPVMISYTGSASSKSTYSEKITPMAGTVLGVLKGGNTDTGVRPEIVSDSDNAKVCIDLLVGKPPPLSVQKCPTDPGLHRPHAPVVKSHTFPSKLF